MFSGHEFLEFHSHGWMFPQWWAFCWGQFCRLRVSGTLRLLFFLLSLPLMVFSLWVSFGFLYFHPWTCTSVWFSHVFSSCRWHWLKRRRDTIYMSLYSQCAYSECASLDSPKWDNSSYTHYRWTSGKIKLNHESEKTQTGDTRATDLIFLNSFICLVLPPTLFNHLIILNHKFWL